MNGRRSWRTQIAAVFLVLSTVQTGFSDTVSEIVRAVKSSEQRFSRFDSVIRCEYRFEGPRFVSSPGVDQITAEDNLLRVRVDGSKFRTDLDREITTPRTPMQLKRVRAYDGKTTRSTEALVANVQEGAQSENHLIRPHTTVLAYAAMSAPLGAYLSGADEFRSVPGQNFPKDRALQVVDEGADMKRDLACRKVSIHHVNTEDGEKTLRRVLWLAVDRNFLPVMLEEYDPSIPFDVPGLVSTVEEFGQTTTGEWYPVKTSIVAYASWVVRTSGKHQVQWTLNVEMKSLDLVENIDPVIFTDVDFSNARMAYKIDNSGTLVDSNRIDSQLSPVDDEADKIEPVAESDPVNIVPSNKIDRDLKSPVKHWTSWLIGALILPALASSIAICSQLSRKKTN